MIVASRNKGFTLLELLVVMVLLGSIMGLVAPQAGRWLSSVQQRGWRLDLKARIEGLPIQAFLGGSDLAVDAEQLSQRLPGFSGAVLRTPAPLRYGASGMAQGGRVELLIGETLEIWVVEPVTGKVTEGSLGRGAP